jgi:hypothetical protein
MSADEAADFARRREDADEEEEQKRSVTPNFSFRSFFEKSDATENEKTKKKNAFQKFMAFEPESVTKDEEEDGLEDFRGKPPERMLAKLEKTGKVVQRRSRIKRQRGGRSRGEEKERRLRQRRRVFAVSIRDGPLRRESRGLFV